MCCVSSLQCYLLSCMKWDFKIGAYLLLTKHANIYGETQNIIQELKHWYWKKGAYCLFSYSQRAGHLNVCGRKKSIFLDIATNICLCVHAGLEEDDAQWIMWLLNSHAWFFRQTVHTQGHQGEGEEEESGPPTGRRDQEHPWPVSWRGRPLLSKDHSAKLCLALLLAKDERLCQGLCKWLDSTLCVQFHHVSNAYTCEKSYCTEEKYCLWR